MEDKLLIIANEFTSESNSDKVNKNKLKSNVTDEKQVIECKYQNAKVMDDYSAYIFLTNCENPIQIDNNSRRYCIFEASSKYKGKFTFFENFINKFYNKNAANTVYTCLLKRDLSKFNILDFPKAEAFYDIVQLNKPSYEIFIESCKGIILLHSKTLKDGKKRISAKELYSLYCEFCIDAEYNVKRKLSNNRFIENLEEFQLVKENNKICFDLEMTYFKDINTEDVTEVEDF